MPKFKLKLLDSKDHPTEAHRQNIEASRLRMLEIIKDLKAALCERSEVDPKFLGVLTSLIEFGEQSKDIFQNDAIDIQLHPEIWAKTNRVGASKVELGEEYSDLPEAGYTALHNILTKKLKTLSRFDKSERKQMKQIDAALHTLEEFQKDAKLIYMEYFRSETALALEAQLHAVKSNEAIWRRIASTKLSDELERLRRELTSIANFSATTMTTRDGGLDYSHKVNVLCDDLKKFNDKLEACVQKGVSNDFDQLANQLRIVAKREADYYYNHPREMTRTDKIRAAVKTIAATIGCVCGISAFIFTFIPVLQIASAPLAIIASIGMIPMFDTTLEVFRNLWAGRSATKAQVIELSIIYPFMAAFIICAHWMPAIAGPFVNHSKQILENLAYAGSLLGSRILPELAGTFYLVRVIRTALEIKEAAEPKTPAHIHHHATISFKRGIEQFHSSQFQLLNKNIVNARKRELVKEIEAAKDKKTGYLYKGRKSTDVISKIHYKASCYNNIRSYKNSMFETDHAKKIDNAIKAYTNLPADESPPNRLKLLDALHQEINQHTQPQNLQKMVNLVGWIVQERETLEEISREMQGNPMNDADNSRIYLTK